MAKLPALVSALAEVDYRGKPTLENVARVVREAGHIPTTKRGIGAAEMTSREAAVILIASFFADDAKSAAAAIPLYLENLRPSLFPFQKKGLPGVFRALTEASNFGEALQILIDRSAEILAHAEDWIDKAHRDSPPELRESLKQNLLKQGALPRLDVEIQKPYPAAVVRFLEADESGVAFTRYEWRFMLNIDLVMAGIFRPSQSDRSTREIAHLKTIMRLKAALDGESVERAV